MALYLAPRHYIWFSELHQIFSGIQNQFHVFQISECQNSHKKTTFYTYPTQFCRCQRFGWPLLIVLINFVKASIILASCLSRIITPFYFRALELFERIIEYNFFLRGKMFLNYTIYVLWTYSVCNLLAYFVRKKVFSFSEDIYGYIIITLWRIMDWGKLERK